MDFVWDYQKGKSKTSLDFLEQETVNGSGIGGTICKFTPHPRQLTTPAPHCANKVTSKGQRSRVKWYEIGHDHTLLVKCAASLGLHLFLV